ncbi:MAG TPA: hypothetical protein VHW23_24060 [Kofleriaceae bacterium]|jgi:hypothetical protein|nr:hypothetical protein [Kofleriaceae bacterium]
MLDATQALTVLAEIPPGEPRALLEQRLAAIAKDLEGNTVFRPRDLPDTHFMRFVIVDDPRGEFPALLAWESNHDGRAPAYLAQVARTAPKITAVFECCAGYPAAGTDDVDGWVAWMLAHAHRAAAFYTGYRGVPRRAVVNARRVHDAIRDVLDGDRAAFDGLSRSDLQIRIRERVAAAHPDLDISPEGDEELRWALGKLAAALVGLVLLPFAVIVAPIWYLLLRRSEERDIATAYARPLEIDPAVRCAEDQVTQNQLTHLVDLRPGGFRLATLWLVLTAIDVAAQVWSVRGDLGGITAIHFARWVIIRDRRPVQPPRHRLLFFSNYDGSWEAYLGEFIDRAAAGLTAVWSNTRGFPATRHLMCAGARDEEAFKQWTREHQLPTQVWWSGVPDSTVQNVRDDIEIRRQLAHGLDDREIESWLRKL